MSWSCPVCTFDNPLSRATCEMCNAIQPPCTSSTTWVCPGCTLFQDLAARCRLCETPNPAEQVVKVAEQAAVTPSKPAEQPEIVFNPDDKFWEDSYERCCFRYDAATKTSYMRFYDWSLGMESEVDDKHRIFFEAKYYKLTISRERYYAVFPDADPRGKNKVVALPKAVEQPAVVPKVAEQKVVTPSKPAEQPKAAVSIQIVTSDMFWEDTFEKVCFRYDAATNKNYQRFYDWPSERPVDDSDRRFGAAKHHNLKITPEQYYARFPDATPSNPQTTPAIKPEFDQDMFWENSSERCCFRYDAATQTSYIRFYGWEWEVEVDDSNRVFLHAKRDKLTITRERFNAVFQAVVKPNVPKPVVQPEHVSVYKYWEDVCEGACFRYDTVKEQGYMRFYNWGQETPVEDSHRIFTDARLSGEITAERYYSRFPDARPK